MYDPLLNHVNDFMMVRQGGLSQVYVGRLIELTPTTAHLQTYQADGQPAARWTLSLETITEFLTDSRQLDNLALKVKWVASPDTITPETAENSNIELSSDALQGEHTSTQAKDDVISVSETDAA